eukprot:2330133-Pyramimonas_sp.AAC.1
MLLDSDTASEGGGTTTAMPSSGLGYLPRSVSGPVVIDESQVRARQLAPAFPQGYPKYRAQCAR